MNETKHCSRCAQDKPSSAFGSHAWCRACCLDYARERAALRTQEERDLINSQQAARRDADRPHYLMLAARWRNNHPDQIKEINAAQYRKPGEKEKRLSYNRVYVTTRKKEDPTFCLGLLLKKQFSWHLNKKTHRQARIELLGTSLEGLQKHLESLFKPGMTWENRKELWHIDHVKPRKEFDLSNVAARKACYHYSNLQPLWWWENLRKGAKWNG